VIQNSELVIIQVQAITEQLEANDGYYIFLPTKRWGYYRKVLLPNPKKIGKHPKLVIVWANTRFATNPRPSWRFCPVNVEQLWEILFHFKKGQYQECADIIDSLEIVRQERVKPRLEVRKSRYRELREQQRLATLDTEQLEEALRKRKLATRAKYLVEVVGLSPIFSVYTKERSYWEVDDIRDRTVEPICNST